MDIFETNIKMIEEYYEKDNYRVEEINTNIKRCLVCFSSHAVYYPFAYEDFLEKIVCQDRYEFVNIAKDKRIRKQFGKIVYMRDLWRTWYVCGINQNIDSVDRIVDKISELSKGYKVVTMGNSGGGYLATIVGIKLRAEVVYNFSGQYSLEPWKNRKWISYYSTAIERSRYYNIVKMVEEAKTPIVYCYPAKAIEDAKQANLVRHCENVIRFAFDSETHGKTVISYNYKYLLELDVERVKKLSKRLSGIMIKAPVFLIITGRLGGVCDCIKWLCKRLFNKTEKRV